MTSTSAERNLLPRVVVVGLGPAGPDLLTAGTLDAIGAASRRFLRTRRHPAAVAVPDAEDFDAVYEASASFDEVYAAIVEAVVAAAEADGEVLYAVPGSPGVAERTVELIHADPRVELEGRAGHLFLGLGGDRGRERQRL